MRVLGIDPGLGRCGWAVVERVARATTALGYGTVATRGEAVAPRLVELAARLREVVARYEPDSFAIERLFVNANALAVALCHLHHATALASHDGQGAGAPSRTEQAAGGGDGGLSSTTAADWLA